MIGIISFGCLSRPRICIYGSPRLLAYDGNGTTGSRKYTSSLGRDMAKSSEVIVMDILGFIQLEGGHPRMWYVGITNDAQRRLFEEHQVHYQDDAWIYRTATSAIEAQRVEEYFLEYGLDGGKASRRPDSLMVYAYRKSIRTEP